MRRLLALAAVAGTLAAGVDAARAETFTVMSAPGEGLSSYEIPNASGSIAVPLELATPPADPEALSYEQLLDLWRRAEAAYGVPWQVLAAINKIESDFGRNMGPSSAGAIGWMQFIPSSWMRWGMDADGDLVADPWDPEDAVFSAARYLAAAGAQEDLSRALFAYNHAQWYVEDVLELAELFGAGDSGLAVFEVDGLEQELADARRTVTEARRLIPPAEHAFEELEWRRLELEQRAGNAELSDERFRALEAKIERVAAAEDLARRELERRQGELERAVAAMEALRAEAAIAALSVPAALSGAAPQAIGEYVFPVGGGPSLVSTAHDHHDYPAADIAAPAGSPLYALANATVIEAYPTPNGKCGIGLKLRLESGAVYVYCHLSYLEPDVVPGAALAAGAPVGLVGSTGHSTGPHLHLALDPTVMYPQEEPWFQSFAGTAFRWQDAPTPDAARDAPARPKRVFRIVEDPPATVGTSVLTFAR